MAHRYSRICYDDAMPHIAIPFIFFQPDGSDTGYMEQTPNRLSKIRRAKGMSQQQLADAVGAHWITISKLERGKMQLTANWANRLAEALDVPLSDFFEAPKAIRELPVVGRITGGTYIEMFDHESNEKILIDRIANSATEWFEVSGHDFEPFFFHNDLIGVLPIDETGFRRAVGRLGHIVFDDGSELFGILKRHIRGNLFDISDVHGDIKKGAAVSSFSVMTSFIQAQPRA